MLFFLGTHKIARSDLIPRAFISINVLKTRVSDFHPCDWIMDSGAFTTIAKNGGFPEDPEVYAEQIRRWSRCGNMLRAVTQDFMCEPFMVERTGLSVARHQTLTIDRYLKIRRGAGEIVMPVLQGYEPDEYAAHVLEYGDLLELGAWVGVGSVCKRNKSPHAIVDVLDAILTERPDLRLHGFGIKTTSLADGRVRSRLYSADSMAWSFAARMAGRNPNDIMEGLRFCQKINAQQVQGDFF